MNKYKHKCKYKCSKSVANALLLLLFQGNSTTALLDNQVLFVGQTPAAPSNGFVAMGTDTFGLADFDNLDISAPS